MARRLVAIVATRALRNARRPAVRQLRASALLSAHFGRAPGRMLSCGECVEPRGRQQHPRLSEDEKLALLAVFRTYVKEG
jgi:hypothetical protein